MKTKAEKLFETYLTENGFRDFEYHPKIDGTTRRPDYCVVVDDEKVFLEVKEFEPPKQLDSVGTFDPYSPIRSKINDAQKQLRTLKGQSCGIVLANPNSSFVMLEPMIIYGAMLGNTGITMPFDPEGGAADSERAAHAFLSEGKMIRYKDGHALAPQNTTISAIIVLGWVAEGRRRLQISLEEKKRGIGEHLSLETLWDMTISAQGTEADSCRYELHIQIYENPYCVANLVEGFGRGPWDERFGERDGRLRRLFVGSALRDLEAEAVAVMLEKYEIVRDMFHGFDYQSGLSGTPQARLGVLAAAIEWILDLQQRDAEKETSEEGKKRANRRFNDAVLALSKAFALGAASDEAREIRDEVGFFQTVRAALAKSAPGSGKTAAEKDFAVQQIVSRAVVSTEIVDIMKAAGLESPDISILSDEFLAEVQQMEKKNLAMEALKKLINGEIRSRSKVNVVQTRSFSERLENAIARYHTNAISTAEVIQELIGLAKDIRAARMRGEEGGLSEEEISFYDALAENKSAVEVMGDERLRVIAHELLTSLKENVTVDWAQRDAAQARMRVLVKRILRKYGYPPDLQDAAVQTVLQQAEVLLGQVAA